MSRRALKTYIFYCSNHLDADQLIPFCREFEPDIIKPISLPCSGKLDVPYLIKAFETGADGVVIVACNKNECRHIEGNLRAHKRAEAVESLLDEIGMGTGRVAVFECEERGGGRVLADIKRFIERVRNLPPSAALKVPVNQEESTAA